MTNITDSEHHDFKNENEGLQRTRLSIHKFEYEEKECNEYVKKARIDLDDGIGSKTEKFKEEIYKHEFKRLKEKLKKSEKWEEY